MNSINNKDETVEDIKVYWSIEEGWDSLPYEKKLERYWLFKIENGIRVYG